ncbi:MAG: zf-HC2 domain-containing protein, partial [Chloroflexota bacterium]|nr:zf-HC2 domain-containing protein [Chloroflexota bacterium]
MNCKDARVLFEAYLDGELAPSEQENIRVHLSACTHCQTELEALVATQKAVRHVLMATAAATTLSPRAWAEIRQRLAAEEQPRVTIWRATQSKLRERGTMIRETIARQPAWRTVTVAVLAMALIAGLSLGIPSGTNPAYAEAAEIAQNAPEVKAALGENVEEITLVKVVQVGDGKGVVVCGAAMSPLVAANVDLVTKKVTEVESIPMPELTEEDQQKAISIAEADPEVQGILADGGTIENVFPVYTMSAIKVEEESDKVEVPNMVMMAMVHVRQGDTLYVVEIDLEKECVLSVSVIEEAQEPQVTVFGGNWPHSFQITDKDGLGTEILDIARSDPEVMALIDDGATLEGVMGFFTTGFIKADSGANTALNSPSQNRAWVMMRSGEACWKVHIDMDAREVTEITPVDTAWAPFSQSSEADEQAAIDIAMADPGIQELLALGGSINNVALAQSGGMSVTISDTPGGEEETVVFSGQRAMVEIICAEKAYIAEIDLVEQKVVRLMEHPGSISEEPSIVEEHGVLEE